MQVRAEGLGHEFDPSNPLFEGLDFELSAGDLVALTGPSGSGKSTLLSILAKWEPPAHGTLEWVDLNTVGWVFQNPIGVPGRTVLDHAALPLLAKGMTRQAANDQARSVLVEFGLGQHADKPYAQLSGGEAQRLMLARAVAKAPSLLLVDEPTAQLDPNAAAAVNEVLGRLAQQHSIVVVATHDPDTRDACHRRIELGKRHPAPQKASA